VAFVLFTSRLKPTNEQDMPCQHTTPPNMTAPHGAQHSVE
jgi:hypothetical protein